MRIVIIGGSGHVGTYLVPMLVEAGHQVVNVSRGQAKPYLPNAAWSSVETVVADRAAQEAAGTFGSRIASLGGDVVVDMISFTLTGTQHLVEALRGKVGHFLHCGTIWVYGHNQAVPATESDPLNPFGEYWTQKAAIETWLLTDARKGFPATVFRPGHIVGPGWLPLDPAGHFNADTYSLIKRGDELAIANFGCALNPFNTLKHLAAEYVKVDGSYTQDLSRQENQEALRTLLAELHEQKRLSIVPFVESATVLATLWQAGVSYIQGHYLQGPSQSMDYDFSSDES